MGIFSKLANAIFNPLHADGIATQYKKFLEFPNEYNTEVLDCADVNYSINVFNEFVKKNNIPIGESKDQGFVHFFTFEYDGILFQGYMFKHFARSLTVSLCLDTKETEMFKILDFCNQVNAKEFIHQVGAFVDDETGHIWMRVTRQMLFTPNIGSVESFANDLIKFKQYASGLAGLKKPDTIDLRNDTYRMLIPSVATAEEWWFDKETSALTRFIDTSEIIYEDEDVIQHSMINMLDGSTFLLGTNNFLKGSLTTFKKYPYLMLASTHICEAEDGIPYIDINKAVDVCNKWNSRVHMAPARMYVEKTEDDRTIVELSMIGYFADDCNTRTFVDFLCTCQKATAQLYNCVG